MLSCREATRLVSEGLDRKLPLFRRLSLRFHVLMCAACKSYKEQVEGLDRLIRSRFAGEPPLESGPDIRLPDEARNRIRKALGDPKS